ncbi:MAG: hypothetical protein BMS9Abin05_1176 [Rhodothermia bacterium]|nr:MAG: hypothetical protein BMS9Abin05_1176 [Rhodothermia bacterium]
MFIGKSTVVFVLTVGMGFFSISCDTFGLKRSFRPDGMTGRTVSLPPATDLGRGLRVLYLFDGNVRDTSGHGLHGLVVGTTLVPDRFGTSENAIQFDGLDDYIWIQNSSSLKLELPISISMWVKLGQVETTMASFTSDFHSERNTGVFATFGSRGANAAFSFGDGGRLGQQSRRTKHGSTKLAPGVWYHVAGTIVGPDSITVYLNGENDGGRYDGSAESVVYSDGSANIGRRTATPRARPIYFFGALDEFAVYDRVLSAREIRLLYTEGFSSLLRAEDSERRR